MSQTAKSPAMDTLEAIYHYLEDSLKEFTIDRFIGHGVVYVQHPEKRGMIRLIIEQGTNFRLKLTHNRVFYLEPDNTKYFDLNHPNSLTDLTNTIHTLLNTTA